MFTINDQWETGNEQDKLNESLFGTVNLPSYKKDDGSCTDHVNKLKRKIKVKDKDGKKKARYIVNEDESVENNMNKSSPDDKVTETDCVHIKKGKHDIDKEAVKGPKKKKKNKNNDKKITVEISNDIKVEHTDGHRVSKTQIDTNVDDGTLTDIRNFNELYSDSDGLVDETSDVCKRMKKRKTKKDREKEGDVMVISESNETETSNGKTNRKHKEKHCGTKSDENIEVENTKPTKCKKKKREKQKKQDTKTNVELGNVLSKTNVELGKVLSKVQADDLDDMSPNNVFDENIEKDCKDDCKKVNTKSKLKKKKKKKVTTVEPSDIAPKRNKNAPILNNDDMQGNTDQSTETGENIDKPNGNIDDNNSPSSLPFTKLSHRNTSKYRKFQQKIVERLKGGQFRWINERLYSCKSSDAVNMFVTDPTLFNIYHNGFHSQVQQWPQNPVDVMIQYIKRREGDVVVADFGCGDAKLASSVPNKVHSFDLVAVNERVTACDMKKVPLRGNCIDIAVFCLSLMGTNLVDFLVEAHRVIKVGGILKIAEVKSRFEDVDKFNQDVSSLGFSLVEEDDSNKMFILLEFQKGKEVPSKRATNITLNPCIYKRR